MPTPVVEGGDQAKTPTVSWMSHTVQLFQYYWYFADILVQILIADMKFDKYMYFRQVTSTGYQNNKAYLWCRFQVLSLQSTKNIEEILKIDFKKSHHLVLNYLVHRPFI